MSEGGTATTSGWSTARDTYYWYARPEDRAVATEFAEVCEWALEEAESAKDLAHVATLIAGAGLVGVLGPRLEVRIAEHVQMLHAERRRRDALADARYIGEALLTLRRGITRKR